ncbi:hypothetical protein INR49_030261 [Caranx melampygus]|nr:hypothetical protein INR49_030261 [Caranx melampygus]
MYKLILQSSRRSEPEPGPDVELSGAERGEGGGGGGGVQGCRSGWMDAACTEDWKPAAASVHRTAKRLPCFPWTSTSAEENAAPLNKNTGIHSARTVLQSTDSVDSRPEGCSKELTSPTGSKRGFITSELREKSQDATQYLCEFCFSSPGTHVVEHRLWAIKAEDAAQLVHVQPPAENKVDEMMEAAMESGGEGDEAPSAEIEVRHQGETEEG